MLKIKDDEGALKYILQDEEDEPLTLDELIELEEREKKNANKQDE